MMRRLSGEAGVAMITVLFVAAVLTMVISAAAFVTVQEFRSGSDDRRAGKALATAEAGIDRTILWLRSFQLPWKEIALSGCTDPSTGVAHPTQGPGSTLTPKIVTLSGVVDPTGNFSATIRPFNPHTQDPTFCPSTVPSPKGFTYPGQASPEPYAMIITSTGSIPTATRVVRQEVRLSGVQFPIGISAGTIDANGNPTFNNITVMSTGIINGRNKMNFAGTDPYYTKGQFYPTLTGATAAQPMPAAAHSGDKIYVSAGRQEHPPNPNCTADKSGLESTWDGSLTGGTVSGGCTDAAGLRPPTTRFTTADINRIAPTPRLSSDDHVYFKDAAQTRGLYCDFRTSLTNPCTVYQAATGTVVSRNIGTNVNAGALAGIGNYYVAYFEFAPGSNPFTNVLRWSAQLPLCNTNSATNSMGVVIMKNGSFEMQTGGRISGAVFAEDGRIDASGNYTIEGTVVAKELRLRGNPTYTLTPCWVQNLPGPFITVTAGRWSELDQVTIP